MTQKPSRRQYKSPKQECMQTWEEVYLAARPFVESCSMRKSRRATSITANSTPAMRNKQIPNQRASHRPRPLPAIREETLPETTIRGQPKDKELYSALARIRAKQARIDAFMSLRPTLTWQGMEDQSRPTLGSWHSHPDMDSLYCLLWDGPVPQQEAERRGNYPPTSVIQEYMAKHSMSSSSSSWSPSS